MVALLHCAQARKVGGEGRYVGGLGLLLDHRKLRVHSKQRR